MRLVVVTDLHGHADATHRQALRDACGGAEALIVCGDFTTFGDVGQAQTVAEMVRVPEIQNYFVFGNCDAVPNEGGIEGWLNLHGRLVERDGWFFAGIGGALPCPSHTPNEIAEAEYTRLLGRFKRACGDRCGRLVLVVHQPPYDTEADRLTSGAHVGCRALRAFIDDVQPACCLTGHIHEAASRSLVGRTVVLNPGPFARNGAFGILDL